MRVLMITCEWPSAELPHAVPFLVRQVEALRAAGVEVDLFSFRGGRRPRNYVRAWNGVRRRMRGTRYDLVHAQWGQSALLALPRRAPLVVTMRGEETGWVRYAAVLVNQVAARFADARILVAPHLARGFRHLPATVIPSGLDLHHFRPSSQREARVELGLPLDRRLVLFVGNPANPGKRYSLCRAAVDLLGPDLKADLVTAWGVPHQRMPLYMNACDVLAVTSRAEGSPNCVKEALACNRAVVSVPVGDVPDRLRDVEGCIVCPDDRPESVAAALDRVLRRAARVHGIAAVQDLDEAALTTRVLDLYRRLLDGRPAGGAAPVAVGS